MVIEVHRVARSSALGLVVALVTGCFDPSLDPCGVEGEGPGVARLGQPGPVIIELEGLDDGVY